MDALTKPKRKTSFSASTKSRKPPYPDLHDHVRALEKAGQLVRVDRPINKDTEMHPLVRWQFRGGINCPFDQIDTRWVAAAARPIPPRIIANAPCHEIVITGKELDKPGKGL